MKETHINTTLISESIAVLLIDGSSCPTKLFKLPIYDHSMLNELPSNLYIMGEMLMSSGLFLYRDLMIINIFSFIFHKKQA